VVVLIAGAAVVAAAVGVGGALWLGNRSHPSPAAGRVAFQSARGEADQVAAALRKLPTDPASLVAGGARAQVGGRARQAFPPGTTVAPRPGSWAPDGAGGGTMLVTVTVPGHRPVSYDAVMVSEAHRWKVLATIRVPAARAGGAS
jgi:hypothetical protein